ncbi:MAG: amidohydrolase [Betaproteobacteria bacterium]|nr:amidohydrolase [Betaproteobacteria bacterium]
MRQTGNRISPTLPGEDYMEYRCISADCHIDVSWLPHDLFVSNASQSMKDRMPYVTPGPDGQMWVTKSGLNLGLAYGKGSTDFIGASGVGVKIVPGKVDRIDRMAATGLYTDAAQGISRPATPQLRLQDQERDGIQAEVMYGLLGTGNKLTDREVAVEFYRIYNDWLSSFCSCDRKRFVGLASIPNHAVAAAVAETRRVAKLGLGGLDISVTWDMTPLWNPYWDPFWKAAAEANLPVHFHTIGPPRGAPLPEDSPEVLRLVSKATWGAVSQLFMANLLASVIHCGALERYPTLRIVLGESGIGWIPYVLDRMDYEYEGRYKDLPLKMKPSDYWHRQCRATFQYDRVGARLLDILGVENVMWGSDYPHPDGVFPDSQEYIQRQFSDLPGVTQRKIICENAGKFYGLIDS